MQKVVIVMPTYNEADNIGLMVETLFKKIFPKISGAEMQLLVVDDNSPDGTGKIVKKLVGKHKGLHLLSGKKEGLGKAYVRGMKYAMSKLGADAIVEMDADFQHNPKYLPEMVGAYLKGADYVVGSRYVAGGSIPADWEWYRKALSYFGNLFARVVLFLPNLHDVTTGFRLTRVAGVLDRIALDKLMELARFAYKIDLFYQTVKLSKKTVEIPISFASRAKEKSKFSMQEAIASYKVVLLIRIYRNKRFVKYGIVGFIGYLINATGFEVFFRAGFTAAVAAALGAELAIISNFIFNNAWTFRENKITARRRTLLKFLQFNASSAGAILIQAAVVGVGVALVGQQWRQLILVVAVGFFVVPYNYLMYNLVIWKTWDVNRLKRLILR